MNYFTVMFLGMLQGIAEFLPISSSGHLVIAQSFFGIGEEGLAIDVALHFGTFLSIIVVFRKEIIKIFDGLLSYFKKEKRSTEQVISSKIGLLIILASIPAGIVGVFFGDKVETLFASTTFVGFALLITAAILFVGNRISGTNDFSEISTQDAFTVGLWQAFAVLPGISRSGSTIIGAKLRGIDSETSAKFSLLLSLPAVLGANIISINKINSGSIQPLLLLAGVVVSFISGIFAINILVKMTVSKKLNYFAWWCLAVGLLTLAFKR